MTTVRSTKSNDRSLLRHGCLLLSLTFVFAWLTLAPAPKAFGVVPAPDGGYPNFTTAEGANALFSLTTGSANTGVGFFSLFSNATGSFNTAIGAGALDLNTADNNTATGAAALLLNTTGMDNTANGVDALALNDTGSQNTADGALTMFNNTIGNSNVALGFHALFGNTSGDSNIAIGVEALFNNTTATGNTAVGQGALFTCRGAQNTAIGAGAGFSVSTASNVIVIGANVPGANVTGSCFIGHIRGVATQHADAIPVVIDTVGQLGTVSSSRRFKKEIKAMEGASESVLALKPVMFRYKSDDTGTPQFGLIAEEVAEVNPVLVVRDENGEIYTVRYDAVNAMLLNEFLKEHRRVDQQENTIAELESTVAQQREDFDAALAQQRKDFDATITELKKGIETVTVRLNKQAAQIQNVNAQMEVSKPIARMALNNP